MSLKSETLKSLEQFYKLDIYPYSMKAINQWLVDKESSYIADFKNWRCRVCNLDGLPCLCCTKTWEYIFKKIYEQLEEINKLHQNESYFESELLYLESIKNDNLKLKEWVLKNETLGASEYICFYHDYLDYERQPFHLSIYCHNCGDLHIYINGYDFEYTKKFLEIFNNLYFHEQVHLS